MSICKTFMWLLPYGLFISTTVVMVKLHVSEQWSQISTEKHIQQVQAERKRMIKETCDSVRLPDLSQEVYEAKLKYLLVDDTHGIIYCYIPKVACTHFKAFMQVLKMGEPYGGLISKGVHHNVNITFLASFPPIEAEARLKHYTKFLFVREPFNRLVSAFRDRFETYNAPYYKDFGQYILQHYSNHKNPPRTAKEARAAGISVTFNNFIQYLLDPQTQHRDFNFHWRQMYQLCHPCFVPYDFVGHQESLSEDFGYLMRILKMQDEITFLPAYTNTTAPDFVKSFFNTVSYEDRKQVFELYKDDYRFFGYKKPTELIED